MSPRLEIRGVDKVYDAGRAHAVRAVSGLDLAVEPGEIVALLGSSGCGKTSTLRMIAGFEEVTAGEILIEGAPVHTLPPARRGVAMAFEGYSLYPPLTLRRNIALALRAQRLPPAEVEARVAEVAHLVEIEDVLDRYPSSVSGGQQQRTSLARALVRPASLHLLDEPMGQLEPQLRALIRGRLKHYVKERGLTAILVTHDQTEANALADRIAVMEGGVLQQFDTPERIRERPANLFTGTFIGEPPMNVFPAEARMDAGRLSFALGEGVTLDYPADAFPAGLCERLAREARVTVGVRPHAVRIGEAGDEGAARAIVYANQWLGDQSHVAARFAGGVLVAVEHERAWLAPGEAMSVDIAARELHVFDTASGAALAHGAAPAETLGEAVRAGEPA
ncbi:MAG: ABC transporter ATP-binding protein [Paracoccaceae bacterium]